MLTLPLIRDPEERSDHSAALIRDYGMLCLDLLFSILKLATIDILHD
jgi:hypothetical protein